MTNLEMTGHKGQIVGHTVQAIAAMTTAAIILPIVIYAYGQSMSILEQTFSFGAPAILFKTLLATAMLIMVFFARPRSKYLRVSLGVLSTVVLAYAVYGAIAHSLALGDALIYLVGSFIGLTETLEANLPQRSNQPASNFHHLPTAKP